MGHKSLLLLLLGVIVTLVSASSAPTFCKCSCFKNSTIIPLGPDTDSASSLRRHLSPREPKPNPLDEREFSTSSRDTHLHNPASVEADFVNYEKIYDKRTIPHPAETTEDSSTETAAPSKRNTIWKPIFPQLMRIEGEESWTYRGDGAKRRQVSASTEAAPNQPVVTPTSVPTIAPRGLLGLGKKTTCWTIPKKPKHATTSSSYSKPSTTCFPIAEVSRQLGPRDLVKKPATTCITITPPRTSTATVQDSECVSPLGRSGRAKEASSLSEEAAKLSVLASIQSERAKQTDLRTTTLKETTTPIQPRQVQDDEHAEPSFQTTGNGLPIPTESSLNSNEEHDEDESDSEAERRSKSTSCSVCTKAFCLAQGIDFCKDATEADVTTMCFQRDSNKDKVIVWGFIIGVLGLLGWTVFKRLASWRASRQMPTYAAMEQGYR